MRPRGAPAGEERRPLGREQGRGEGPQGEDVCRGRQRRRGLDELGRGVRELRARRRGDVSGRKGGACPSSAPAASAAAGNAKVEEGAPGPLARRVRLRDGEVHAGELEGRGRGRGSGVREEAGVGGAREMGGGGAD